MSKVICCALEGMSSPDESMLSSAPMEELDRLRSLYQAIRAIESNRGELPSDLSYPSREDEQELFRRVTDMFRRFKGLARIVSGEHLAHYSQTDDATEVARDTATGSRDPQRHEQLDVRYLEEVCALLKERLKLARSVLDGSPSNSEEDEALLESLENLKRGILRIRSYLITSNRGLVFSSVASMCKSEKAKRIRDDLESSGMLGLVSAVDSFDWRYGVRLSTFATQAIRWSILGELERHGLAGKKGEERMRVLSLDQARDSDETRSLLSLIEDPRCQAPEISVEIRDEMESVLTRLRDGLCLLDFSTLRQTERAKVLLSRVLGLDGQEADSIADVAASLKISRSAAADILRVALRQLGIDRQSLPISRVSKFS